MASPGLSRYTQNVIFKKACYIAGIAVYALILGMEFEHVSLRFSPREGPVGECDWRVNPNRPATEMELMALALSGQIASQLGRGIKPRRPSGADYVYRSRDELLQLEKIIARSYENELSTVELQTSKLDFASFRHLKFEEAWEQAVARLSLPPIVGAIKKLASILSEGSAITRLAVNEILLTETRKIPMEELRKRKV